MQTYTTMPVIIVPVKPNQTLSEVEQIYPLPTNGIFHKILPGLGATYGEIHAKRHSIIVLPNKPVIESKAAKHNAKYGPAKAILAVHKGVKKADIVEYLSKTDIIYKKILITPESYDLKLKDAVADIFDYIKREFYLLIDECERSIQDIDYRHKVTAPFDDFFSFTNKGLISATTLPFSEPAFEIDFTHYVIQPDFKYNKPLHLICTNNIITAFKEYILDTPSECYFVFCSSITAMTAVVSSLGITLESKIHCSESKVTSLKMQHFNASSTLDNKQLKKYNFLTSRFYSALDIELPFKADVLMFTEVLFAEHSILDPQTEVIQIVGRFRNGTKSVTHITNFDPEIKFKTPEEARNYMDGQREVYNQILKLKQTMTGEGAQEAISQILTEPKFAKFFKPDGSYNWFMMDNYIQEQRVMGLYQSIPNLFQGYKQVEDHFDLTTTEKFYTLTDKDRLKRQSVDSRKEEVKMVVDELLRIEQRADKLVIGGEEHYQQLKTIYPDVVDAYETIGSDRIKEAGYLESRMKAAVIKAKKDKQRFSTEVLKAISSIFKENETYTEIYITTTLQDIYDRLGIKDTAYATHILRYYDATRTTRKGTQHKVYVITKTLDRNNQTFTAVPEIDKSA